MKIRIIVKIDGVPAKGVIDLDAESSLLALGVQTIAESLAARLPAVAYEQRVTRIERTEDEPTEV